MNRPSNVVLLENQPPVGVCLPIYLLNGVDTLSSWRFVAEAADGRWLDALSRRLAGTDGPFSLSPTKRSSSMIPMQPESDVSRSMSPRPPRNVMVRAYVRTYGDYAYDLSAIIVQRTR